MDAIAGRLADGCAELCQMSLHNFRVDGGQTSQVFGSRSDDFGHLDIRKVQKMCVPAENINANTYLFFFFNGTLFC